MQVIPKVRGEIPTPDAAAAITLRAMGDHATLVVHRALMALHAGDIMQLTRQLDGEVIYDSGHELVSGSAAVAAAIAAPRFEHRAAEIIPGSVEHEGDRLIAHMDALAR